MKIIKTAKYLEKISQFDDYGDSYEPYEGSDIDNWENEQVFRDREGREDDYDPDDHLSIEPYYDSEGQIEGYEAVEHGVYPDSSVLAGQSSRKVIDHAETVEELQQRYPNAEVSEHSTHMPSSLGGPRVSDVPPADFDPSDAGESWDEQY